jgi:citrate synthase
MKDVNLDDIFSVSFEGEYTVLHLKNAVNKMMIYDPGLYHTAICKSALCTIDKNDGKLYYRGKSVESLLDLDFLDAAYFIIFGEREEGKSNFKRVIIDNFRLLKEQKDLMDAIPLATHPMDALSMAVIGLGGIESKYLNDPTDIFEKAGFLIAQVAITVAYRYTQIQSENWVESTDDRSYAERILFQMHAGKNQDRLQKLGKILNTIMILHAEHGQNCSAATVRSVASARSSLYPAVASGMAAFNGMIHGGASQLVSAMYEELLESGLDVDAYVDKKIESKTLLMGFGQRTYNRILNCWDPRVERMYQILTDDSFDFPEIVKYREAAIKLIDRVSRDEFYKKRNLTPNPDLFNCIFYKLFGVPREMNTCMLALGRIAGWIANYVEHVSDAYPLTRPCDMTCD